MRHFAFILLLSSGPVFAELDPAGTAVFKILANQEPSSGAPVFGTKNLPKERLEAHLDRFIFRANNAEEIKWIRKYFNDVAMIPFRFGTDVDVPKILTRRNGRAVFNFNQDDYKLILLFHIRQNFWRLRSESPNSPIMNYLIDRTIRDNELTRQIIGLTKVGRWARTDDFLQTILAELYIDPDHFEEFCLKLIQQVIERELAMGRFTFITRRQMEAFDVALQYEPGKKIALEILETISKYESLLSEIRSGSMERAVSILGTKEKAEECIRELERPYQIRTAY